MWGYDCITWFSGGNGRWYCVLADGTEIEYIPAGYGGAPYSGWWYRAGDTYDYSYIRDYGNTQIGWHHDGYTSTFQTTGGGQIFLQDSAGNSLYLNPPQ